MSGAPRAHPCDSCDARGPRGPGDPCDPCRTAYLAGWTWLLAATVAYLRGTVDLIAWSALLVGATAAGSTLVRVVGLLRVAPHPGHPLGAAVLLLAWPAASGAEMLRVLHGAPAPAPLTLVAASLVVMELLAVVAFARPTPPASRPRQGVRRASAAPGAVEAPRKRISCGSTIA